MRIRTGLFAQVYSQSVTIALQLLSVPVLLHAWGVEGYGVWLILIAVPTYFGLADLGFVQVAASEMTMKVAAGDRDAALRIFQSAQSFILMICAFIVAAVAMVLYFAPVTRWLGVAGHIDESTGTRTLVMLVLQVIFTILFGIVGAGFRAIGHYAIAISSGATARVLEGAALLVTASTGAGFFTAAAVMLAVRILVETAFLLLLRRTAPWLHFGLRHADTATVRRMFWPSLTFMAYSISNMINIQGMTIIVGVVMGPAVVAALNAMRTVSRLGITASNMISHTLQTEYSRYIGAGETSRTKNVFMKHLMAIGALIVAFLLGSMLMGHFIIGIWTKGKLAASEPLFTLLLLGIALEMTWTALQTPLISINRHQTTSTVFLMLSIGGLFVCWMLLPTVGVDSVGYVSIPIGIVMCLLSAVRVRRWWTRLPADRIVTAPLAV